MVQENKKQESSSYRKARLLLFSVVESAGGERIRGKERLSVVFEQGFE